MAENTPVILPSYFANEQFSAKNTDGDLRKHATRYFRDYYKGETPPSGARKFLAYLFQEVFTLHEKLKATSTGETETLKQEVERLKGENAQFLKLSGDAGRWQHDVEEENKKLKEENEELKTEINKIKGSVVEKMLQGFTVNSEFDEKLAKYLTAYKAGEELKPSPEDEAYFEEHKGEIEKYFMQKLLSPAAQPATSNQQPVTELDFSIFEDPRLKPFKGWIKPEHKHPFDTFAWMKQTADDALIDFEKQKAQLQLEPLTMLRGPAREALMKWDREILMPALRRNTGILNLELSGEYKFLIMQDYCMADPIDKVLALLTQNGIIPADPTKWDAKMKKLISDIQDQQFPRAAVIEEILKEMALSQKVKEWATAKYGEAVNKYPFDFLQDQYRAEHEPGYKPIYEANKKTDDTTQPLSADETTGENGEGKVIQLNPAIGNGGGDGGGNGATPGTQ